jgi:2-iminoacetate synthase
VNLEDKIRQLTDWTEAVLGGAQLSEDRARAWLAEPDPAFAVALLRASARVTEVTHQTRIRLFAPLYYSNVCVNNCLYCGFRRDNARARRRILTPDEIELETRALLRMGHRRILLVASEDPSASGRALALSAVARARDTREGDLAVEQLSVEIAPGSVEDFRELALAGVDAYVLFQETYDRARFAEVHPDGSKRDYDWRLEAPSRALAGGIPNVGLGVLFGLGDPVEETIALIRHARRIEDAYEKPPRSISLPRIEPAEGSELSRHPYWTVTDEEMLRMIAVIRLSLPATGIVLSTRESAAFRDAALGWGVTEMSVGSRTDPGGYTSPESPSLAQFELQDERTLTEVMSILRERGFEPYLGADPRPAGSIRTPSS